MLRRNLYCNYYSSNSNNNNREEVRQDGDYQDSLLFSFLAEVHLKLSALQILNHSSIN